MPVVDFAEWYRRQQAAAAANPNFGAVGTQGFTPYQGYQAPRFGEIDKKAAQYNKDILVAGAKGWAAGGPIGGAIGAALAAAPQIIESGQQAWDAAKTGDPRAVSRSLAPISPAMYLHEKSGLPSWTNPLYVPTKVIGELFGGPRTRVEEKRWNALKNAGFDIPKWVAEGKNIKDTGFRKDLAPDFVGYDAQGNWVNNKFAKSRQESDMTAQDISQYAVMPETFGELWKYSDADTRNRVAQMALGGGANIREHHGTLDMQWTPESLRAAQDILAENAAKNPDARVQKRYVIPRYQLPSSIA